MSGTPDRSLAEWYAVMHAGQEDAASGLMPSAEHAFRRAIRLFPTRMEAWANLGAVLLMRADYAEAVRVLERARTLAPESATVRGNLASAYYHAGRVSDALASCRAALAIAPSADTFNQLGAMLRSTWRLDEAEAALRGALAIDARHANAQVNLATTLMLRGRYDEARAWLDVALTMPLPDEAAREATLAHRMLSEWQRLDPELRAALARGDIARLRAVLDATPSELVIPDSAIMPFLDGLATSATTYLDMAPELWPIPEEWPWIEAHFTLHGGDTAAAYLAQTDAAPDSREYMAYAEAVALRKSQGFHALMRDHPEGALRLAHWQILRGENDAKYCPGHFKLLANRVIRNPSEARARPEHVVGSLRDFHDRLLPRVHSPEARALLVYLMILKCHPFIDGNGRVARFMCNAELERAGLPPILIADSVSDDWVRAQRAIYRTWDLGPMLEQYQRARDFTRGFLEGLARARLADDPMAAQRAGVKGQ